MIYNLGVEFIDLVNCWIIKHYILLLAIILMIILLSPLTPIVPPIDILLEGKKLFKQKYYRWSCCPKYFWLHFHPHGVKASTCGELGNNNKKGILYFMKYLRTSKQKWVFFITRKEKWILLEGRPRSSRYLHDLPSPF